MPSVTAPMRSGSSFMPSSEVSRTTAAAAAVNVPRSAGGPGFGIYIHWPFCLSKCPYCDFNSHVRDAVDQDRWRRALLAELSYFRERLDSTGNLEPVTSIFFGGGTPSLMPPDTVAALIESIRVGWPTVPDLEITLEANPTSVETRRLGAVVRAGVNRLSLGIQALDDTDLRFLGRQHSAAEALHAMDVAAATGARRSFDLIYARPGQTAAAWEAELQRAIAIAETTSGGGHLSLYQLTIEEGTGFHAAVRRGDWTPLDDDRAADLYDLTQAVTAGAGLPAYEVSNHAAPGQECRHNLTYWRSGGYAGIGPGAHGRLALAPAMPECGAANRGRTWTALHQIRTPEAWLDAVERDGHGTRDLQSIAPAERLTEALLMGLRLAEGVDLHRLSELAEDQSADVLDASGVDRMLAMGLLAREGSRLTATQSGFRVLDSVIATILAG